MKTIRISDEVWNEIAKRGISGEAPDSILRSVFGIEEYNLEKEMGTKGIAARLGKVPQFTLSHDFDDEYAYFYFSNGINERFVLPEEKDKEGIKILIYTVMNWIRENGGTAEQAIAGREALIEMGYYIKSPEIG